MDFELRHARTRTTQLIWLGALIVVAMVAHAGAVSAQFISAGPLSSDHAKVDDSTSCNRCHAEGKKLAVNQCLSCHKELGARIHAQKGLHGVTYKGKDCGTCHVEHLGRNTKLVKWPSGRREDFNHNDAKWTLQGKHKGVDCLKCHTKKTSTGKQSFLGARTECVACHKDVHEGKFGSACNHCHTESSWRVEKMGAAFDHNLTRYPLKGAHATVQCNKCHTGTPPKYKPLAFGQCTDCHQDPHGGRFKPACATCHNEKSWKDTGSIAKWHPGVSLANGHAKVACVRCHDRGTDAKPSRGTQCVSCHKPVHAANFGKDCASCHRSIEWFGLPRDIALRAHTKTEFQLRGKHESTECSACHKASWSEEKRYRGLKFKECKSCHEDKHRGEFAARKGGECAPCHNEEGFKPTLFTLAMHNQTKFPIAGKHAAAPCSRCHTQAPPRLNMHIKKQECADCHKNPHGDQFAKEMAQGGCASCHTPTGWDNAKVDHSIWPLEGAHAKAACNQCHAPSEQDRKTGKGASYRGVPRECKGCHDDVHAGQFRLSKPEKECNECHNNENFMVENFDHKKHSGFMLTGGHEKLECRACHKPIKLKNKTSTVHYRLGYRACRDCHANPHIAPSDKAGAP